MVAVSAVEISGDSHSAVVADVDSRGKVTVLARVEEPGLELRLPSLLFDAAERVGRGPRELGMIALGLAPLDPSTNHVAMTLLRGFASVTKVPFVAVSAVEALAFEACALAPPSAFLVPAISLPDGRVATAIFGIDGGGRLTHVVRECNVPAAEWVQILKKSKPATALGFGTGYAVHRELVSGLLPELAGAPSYPSAFGVALAAVALARNASTQPPV